MIASVSNILNFYSVVVENFQNFSFRKFLEFPVFYPSSEYLVSVNVAKLRQLLYFLLQVVSNKTSSSKMIRISPDVVTKLGPALLELLRAIIRVSQRKQKGTKARESDKNRLHDVLCQFPVLIDSFTSVLRIYAASQQSRYSAELLFSYLLKCSTFNFVSTALSRS